MMLSLPPLSAYQCLSKRHCCSAHLSPPSPPRVIVPSPLALNISHSRLCPYHCARPRGAYVKHARHGAGGTARGLRGVPSWMQRRGAAHKMAASFLEQLGILAEGSHITRERAKHSSSSKSLAHPSHETVCWAGVHPPLGGTTLLRGPLNVVLPGFHCTRAACFFFFFEEDLSACISTTCV